MLHGLAVLELVVPAVSVTGMTELKVTQGKPCGMQLVGCLQMQSAVCFYMSRLSRSRGRYEE